MGVVKEDALFTVRHHVTEDSLRRLEKGTRLLGAGVIGRKNLTGFFVAAVVCLVLKGFFDGTAVLILSAAGGAMLLICFSVFYGLAKGWAESKQDTKRKYKENQAEYELERE